jgi:hypothetical protein
MEGVPRRSARERDDLTEETFDPTAEERKLDEQLAAAVADVNRLGARIEKVPQALQDRAMAAFSYAELGLRHAAGSNRPEDVRRWLDEYKKASSIWQRTHNEMMTLAGQDDSKEGRQNVSE